MVVAVYLLLGSAAAIARLPQELSDRVVHLGSSLILTILAIAIISRKGWWQRIGLRPPARPADRLWFLLPMVLVAVNLLAGINAASLANLFYFFLLALLAGFGEEAIFRGIILQA
jgi:membrane protease YdiL (CAAX protease family)